MSEYSAPDMAGAEAGAEAGADPDFTGMAEFSPRPKTQAEVSRHQRSSWLRTLGFGATGWITVSLVLSRWIYPYSFVLGLIPGLLLAWGYRRIVLPGMAQIEAAGRLVLDAKGLTQHEQFGTRSVPWSDLVRADVVLPPFVRGTRKMLALPGAATDADRQRFIWGVTGRGVTLPDHRHSSSQVYADNHIRWGTDPGTGEGLVGIDLSAFDLSWDSGPIGAWVKHFRPDVWQQAHDANAAVRAGHLA